MQIIRKLKFWYKYGILKYYQTKRKQKNRFRKQIRLILDTQNRENKKQLSENRKLANNQKISFSITDISHVHNTCF